MITVIQFQSDHVTEVGLQGNLQYAVINYAVLQLHMTVLQLHKLVNFQLGITHIKLKIHGYLWIFMASI